MRPEEDSAELIEFASKYEDLSSAPTAWPVRARYLAEELNRLEREGAPILRAVLARPGTGQCTDEALSLLRAGGASIGDGKERLRAPRIVVVNLRLREGVLCPPVDPNGRRQTEDQRRSRLVVKVGNEGGDLDTTTTLRGVNADQRQILHAQRLMYRTVEITREGSALPLDEAVKALRAWGYGVAVQIKRDFRDRDGVHIQDTWLVEEVPTAKPDAKPKKSAA